VKVVNLSRKLIASTAVCTAVAAAAVVPLNTSAHAAPVKGAPQARTSQSHAQAWSQFTSYLKGHYNGKSMRIIMINDPFVPAFQKVIGNFESLTGAKVTIDQYAYNPTYDKEVLAGTQHSSTYDITVFDLPWMQKFVPYVDSLNSYINKTDPNLLEYNDFFRVMRQGSTWNGQVVGFPFAPYFVLQHYNTKVYSALGLKPAKTLTQFLANAKAANKSSKFPSVYGTAMNNQAGSAVGQAFFEYIYSFANGKPFKSEYPGSSSPYANMTPMFASAQGLAVISFLKSLLPYEPTGALNIDWTQRQSDFNTGRVAAVNQWDVTTPSASDPSMSTVTNAYATSAFPTNGLLTTQVGGWTMGINKYGTQKSLAWDFIKWFTSPESSVTFAQDGGFPARTSALSNATLVTQYPWYNTLRDVVPTAFADCRPRISDSFTIINTLGTYISKALSGSLSAKQAMLDADHDIGTLLKSHGYRVDSLTD